jgi:SAM-dependent methyltransferase
MIIGTATERRVDIMEATPGTAGGQQAEEPDFDWGWAEDDSSWVPPAIDTTRPSVARIYDYALGGKDNFAVDREAAESAFQLIPDAPEMARLNRNFVERVVRMMAQAGIRQFLDLGTGIPTSPAVHEIARELVPGARVVYVDNDPIVLAHSRAMLDGDPLTTSLLRDVREPASVLGDPRLRNVLDLGQPVGLLMVALLHFVDLALAPQVVRHYLDRLATGSYVAVSTLTFDGVPREVSRHMEEIYRETSAPLTFRTLAQVEELFDGLDLLEPGITDVSRWRADDSPRTLRVHAGVGIKR